MEEQRRKTATVSFLVICLAVLLPGTSRADTASEIKQTAARWERCVKEAVEKTADDASRESTLEAVRRSCQSLKNATLALVADSERASLSASMDAAMKRFVDL